VTIFLMLLVAHALCDFPLQGDFLARAKNPAAPIDGVPWQWAMGAHAAIHAGAVGYCTGSLWCAVAEFFAHWALDCVKCHGGMTFSQDQMAHIACKGMWAVLATVTP
jgi:hypothetical protein